MKTVPAVTIVLPTFNGAAFLDEAIRSVIDQTFRDWELIIVDDASTDNTAEIAAWHAQKDSRIRLYRHAENGRLPKALNTGFEHAQGVYLTWTSDDNLYRAETIAVLVQYLDGHPEVDVVYSDYSVIDETTGNTVEVAVREPEILARYNCIGPCFLYRREVQRKLSHYDEDLFLAEDFDFWSRASRHFTISPLHRNLYIYRNHAASLTASRQQAVIEASARVLIRNYAPENLVPAALQAQGWLHLVEKSIACGNIYLARRYLVMALKAAPRWVMGTEAQLVTDIFINRPAKKIMTHFTRTMRAMLG
jgi:glycosyltransferase involved in cell wall biosynthesis